MQEINCLFLLSRDYLIVWTAMRENEHFMIIIRLKNYSVNIQDLSNLYKR